MIRLLACISLLFFLVPVTYVHGPKPIKNDSQYISLQPIAFYTDDPKRKTAGRLEFLRGWKMTSANPDLGGVSSMLVSKDDQGANRFFMLSDAGVLIGFTLDEQSNKALRPFIAPLPDGPPKENKFAKKNWDAESLVHDPKTGQYWVGYEIYHGVWRYGRSFARKEAALPIPAMQKWPRNGGAEAMLRLPDGRFLIFSESAPFKDEGYQAYIFDRDPTDPEAEPTRFGYLPPKGFSITDAALLPDGKALLLNRRFTPLEGVSAIVSIGDLSEIEPGQSWRSKTIATLKPPMKVDNMEALAVTQEGEDVIVWIASDDNFNAIQETILMKFRLARGKQKRSKANRDTSPGFSALDP